MPIENITVILDPVPESILYNETYSLRGRVIGFSNPSGKNIEIKAEDGSEKGSTLTFDHLDSTGNSAHEIPAMREIIIPIFLATRYEI